MESLGNPKEQKDRENEASEEGRVSLTALKCGNTGSAIGESSHSTRMKSTWQIERKKLLVDWLELFETIRELHLEFERTNACMVPTPCVFSHLVKKSWITLCLHHKTCHIEVRQLQIKGVLDWGCCMLHLCHRTTATHTWKRFSKLATSLLNEWMNKLNKPEQVTNSKNLWLYFLFTVWYEQTWR